MLEISEIMYIFVVQYLSMPIKRWEHLVEDDRECVIYTLVVS